MMPSASAAADSWSQTSRNWIFAMVQSPGCASSRRKVRGHCATVVPDSPLQTPLPVRPARSAAALSENSYSERTSEVPGHQRVRCAMARLISDRPVLHTTSELGRIMGAAKARELAGERILHLERGEPDFDTPPHIVEALAKAARDGATHYPDQWGERSFREALVEKLARENGISAHVDDIVVTAGGTHALFLAMQTLLSPGDEILVPSPHWMAIPKLVGF